MNNRSPRFSVSLLRGWLPQTSQQAILPRQQAGCNNSPSIVEERSWRQPRAYTSLTTKLGSSPAPISGRLSQSLMLVSSTVIYQPSTTGERSPDGKQQRQVSRYHKVGQARVWPPRDPAETTSPGPTPTERRDALFTAVWCLEVLI